MKTEVRLGVLQQIVLLILAPVKALMVSAVIEPLETKPLEPPQNLAAGMAAPEMLFAPGTIKQSKPRSSFPVIPYAQHNLWVKNNQSLLRVFFIKVL